MDNILALAASVTATSLASGALIPIETDYCVLNDRGIDFVVRIARNLDRKKENVTPSRTTLMPFNPFLPYDAALWVADIGAHHAVLLNKFNVIDHHLLLVTTHYESQDQLLTDTDLHALSALITRHGGLGFYNGGTLAGASQHHKHLQWIPGVELRGEICVPMTPHLPNITNGSWQIVTEPFPMALAKFDTHASHALQCIDFYRSMTQQSGIDMGDINASQPYNLLVTASHLWLVPRVAESFESISLNAMAFAGSLFVKNTQQLTLLENAGPLTALKATIAPPCALAPSGAT